MATVKDILDEALKDIIPTQEELDAIDDIVIKLKALLDKRAKELKINYTQMEPQGSTGIKQTQLRHDFDIDFFIGLPYADYKPKYEGLSRNKLKKESKKDFLKLCNEWIIYSLKEKEFKNPSLLYAEHPYVTVDYTSVSNIKLKVDVVLYFDLAKEFIKNKGPITAVDRSPWHGRYVRDNLNRVQKNDVRLLKQFFKACNSYGDKSALGMMGFIGYSAELLVHHFGNIQQVFNNLNKLPNNPIDFHGRSPSELNKITHFANDFLIITDPTDPNRNVASAISEKAYRYCNSKVQDFLANPNITYFTINPIPEADLSNKNDLILQKCFIIETDNINPEKHYTINRDKLYKLGESIKSNGEKEFSHAKRFGSIYFEVYFEYKINKYNLAIYCENPTISPTYLRRGPPIKEQPHAENFKKKNPNHYEKDGFLWVESNRKFIQFDNFLTNFVKNKLPDNLKVINISNAFETKTPSGKRAITVLKDMVLPFNIK